MYRNGTLVIGSVFPPSSVHEAYCSTNTLTGLIISIYDLRLYLYILFCLYEKESFHTGNLDLITLSLLKLINRLVS